MKKISLSICMFLLISNFLTAKTITGTVTSNELPLLGVSVQLKGSPVRAITDFDGIYTIEVKEGDVLEFSSIGFKTQKITVQKSSVINIYLVEKIETLYEVVVIGNKAKVKKDVVGSVVSVKAEDIEKVSTISFEQALGGCGFGSRVRVRSSENRCSLNLKAKLFRL